MDLSAPSILIIEPNTSLSTPYIYIPHSFNRERISTIIQAKEILSHQLPSITFLSASLPLVDTLEILEIIKKNITVTIPPLIFVVDVSYPISSVPGTTWGGKISVIDTFLSPQEFLLGLTRLLS